MAMERKNHILKLKNKLKDNISNDIFSTGSRIICHCRPTTISFAYDQVTNLIPGYCCTYPEMHITKLLIKEQ